MVECIFTIDYEIYGNGAGSLQELIYDPGQKLQAVFKKWNVPFVAFVEASELEIINEHGGDPAIDSVERQVREFYQNGIEIALHLHPQWYNARFERGNWILDYDEYNLCNLPRERIDHIVGRSINYLRGVLGERDFTPISFRAGNWLFQPTATAAQVLAEHGIRIDSSVFKGGLQRNHRLDYRPALANGYYWRFDSDANVPSANGPLLEVPTYAVMVPFWRMLTGKRVALQKKSGGSGSRTLRQKVNRYLDLLRPLYPLKFDFCRMTLDELTTMMDAVLREDRQSPGSYKPVVAIGHTKDLVDLETVDRFLNFLKENRIPVSRLDAVLERTRSTMADFDRSAAPQVAV